MSAWEHWQSDGEQAGFQESLPVYCKGYLWANSQKYCEQQATGSELRS